MGEIGCTCRGHVADLIVDVVALLGDGLASGAASVSERAGADAGSSEHVEMRRMEWAFC
jgi:hypothetical protein